MFRLYHSKKDKVLRIEKAVGLFKEVTDTPIEWNDCYYSCNNRKELLKLAKKIKRGWILEAAENLDQMVGIEILNKY